ncbi:MAG: phasin family protein [Pseudanabaenaceae cyanobacterium]
MNPITPISGIARKAFYLGLGLASLATEKAGATLADLREQAIKLADDLVARGEMTSEEARKFVEDLLAQAQGKTTAKADPPPRENPRPIEILDGDTEEEDVATLQQKLQALQEELKRLQK